MDNQSAPTNPTDIATPTPITTPSTPTTNPLSSAPTPPDQVVVAHSHAPLWPKIIIVLLIIVACIEVGYILYKQNSVVVVEQEVVPAVNP